MAAGSLKSHWLSAMPRKSRMAGSAVQELRNAARVNSGGTSACRYWRISLSATIDSIGGRLAGSKAGDEGAGEGTSVSGDATSVSGDAPSDSCFNRDHRDRKFSESLMFHPPKLRPGRWAIGRRSDHVRV